MPVQFIVNGLIAGCLYALVALGFTLIYSTTKIFHFAHAGIYTLSAYLFYTLFNELNSPLWLSFALVVLLISAFGIVIDQQLYRPLEKRGASPLIELLTSLGLYIVIVNLIALFYGNETKITSPGLQPTYSIGSVILTEIQIITAVSFLVLFALLLFGSRKTKLGLMIRAMRDNPDLVSALGINPLKVRSIVFAIASAFAAVAGILMSLDVGMDPHVGMPALLNGAVAAIIGGIAIIEGAALGALLLGVLQSLVVWQASARWQDTMTFLLLILFLLLRPEGILGVRRRVEEAF